MPYIKELTVGVLQHYFMLSALAEDKTDRYMHLEVRGLHKSFFIVMVFAAGSGKQRVRARQIDIGIHVVIGKETEVIRIIGHSHVGD